MELTSDEAKLLANLRAKQAAWRCHRWYVLASGLFCATAGAWLILQIARRAAGGNRWDGEIVWVAPMPWLLFQQGVLICILALRKWHGDPSLRLLLKLFDAAGSAPLS